MVKNIRNFLTLLFPKVLSIPFPTIPYLQKSPHSIFHSKFSKTPIRNSNAGKFNGTPDGKMLGESSIFIFIF